MGFKLMLYWWGWCDPAPTNAPSNFPILRSCRWMNPNFRTLSSGEVSWGKRTQWKKLMDGHG